MAHFCMQPALLLLFLLALRSVSVITAALTYHVPALILLGDSTADVGNNNYLPTTDLSNHPPYGRNFPRHIPTGRWSNGWIVSDFVARELGLPLPLPYLDPKVQKLSRQILKGVNFASAGSGLLDSTAKDHCLLQPGIICNVSAYSTQLQWYRDYAKVLKLLAGPSKASHILSHALYIVTFGTNDILNNYLGNAQLQQQYNLSSFQQLLLHKHTEYLKDLYRGGARRIALAGLPPLGCLPAAIFIFGNGTRTSCVKFLNQIAVAFNQALKSTLSSFSSTLDGAKITYVDIYSYLYDIVNNSEKYGISVGKKGCCGDGYTSVGLSCNTTSGSCREADDYVWWDAGHPTQKTNFLIAQELFQGGKLFRYL